jgi:F0F1-type ATP synthase membrane subunit b/b'
MPIQFEKYRFTKKTPLSDEVFNKIFRDIDLRLAVLEDVKKDWQGAVNELIKLGLSRIETALRPAHEQVEQARNQAQDALSEILVLRQQADQLINQRRDDAINEVNNAKTEALNAINNAKDNALNTIEQATAIQKFYFFFGG